MVSGSKYLLGMYLTRHRPPRAPPHHPSPPFDFPCEPHVPRCFRLGFLEELMAVWTGRGLRTTAWEPGGPVPTPLEQNADDEWLVQIVC